MKLLFTFCFILIFGWLGFSNKKPLTHVKQPSQKTFSDTIDFSSQIQPILLKNCSPCHFPGGKMYQRMPFDKDTTIINHKAGILRRIKGDDNDLIRSFVDEKTKQ